MRPFGLKVSSRGVIFQSFAEAHRLQQVSERNSPWNRRSRGEGRKTFRRFNSTLRLISAAPGVGVLARCLEALTVLCGSGLRAVPSGFVDVSSSSGAEVVSYPRVYLDPLSAYLDRPDDSVRRPTSIAGGRCRSGDYKCVFRVTFVTQVWLVFFPFSASYSTPGPQPTGKSAFRSIGTVFPSASSLAVLCGDESRPIESFVRKSFDIFTLISALDLETPGAAGAFFSLRDL